LFENLFNLIWLLKLSLIELFTEKFLIPSVKGALRYQKINFFKPSVLTHYKDLNEGRFLNG